MTYIVGLISAEEIEQIRAWGYEVEPHLYGMCVAAPKLFPVQIFLDCNVGDLLLRDESNEDFLEQMKLQGHVQRDLFAYVSNDGGTVSFIVESAGGDIVAWRDLVPVREKDRSLFRGIWEVMNEVLDSDSKITTLMIYTSSVLAVRAFHCGFVVYASPFREQLEACWDLAKRFQEVEVHWAPQYMIKEMLEK